MHSTPNTLAREVLNQGINVREAIFECGREAFRHYPEKRISSIPISFAISIKIIDLSKAIILYTGNIVMLDILRLKKKNNGIRQKVREGKLPVNSGWNITGIKFTVQDTCNVVRKSLGDKMADDLRYVDETVVDEKNFVDMAPNKSNNYCCE